MASNNKTWIFGEFSQLGLEAPTFSDVDHCRSTAPLRRLWLVMKALFNRMLSGFTFKFLGSSQTSPTAESPRRRANDLVFQCPWTISQTLKREASVTNPYESPHKRRKMNDLPRGHTVAASSSHSEAEHYTLDSDSSLGKPEWPAMSSIYDHRTSMDVISQHASFSEIRLDLTPSRSPTPSLAFDIPSSDCDYDFAAPGDSVLLDYGDDSHLTTDREFPVNQFGIHRDKGLCDDPVINLERGMAVSRTAYSQEFEHQNVDSLARELPNPVLDFSLGVSVPSFDTSPSLACRFDFTSVDPVVFWSSSSGFERRISPHDCSTSPQARHTSQLPSASATTRTKPGAYSEIFFTDTKEAEFNRTPVLCPLPSDDVDACASQRSKTSTISLGVMSRIPGNVSPVSAFAHLDADMSTGLVSDLGYQDCSIALNVSHPQDIPPPIRPPGALPSRPSSPEPQRPRPVRPSSEWCESSYVTRSAIKGGVTAKAETASPAAFGSPATAYHPAACCKPEPTEPTSAHLSLLAPRASDSVPLLFVSSTSNSGAPKQEPSEGGLYDDLQNKTNGISLIEMNLRAKMLIANQNARLRIAPKTKLRMKTIYYDQHSLSLLFRRYYFDFDTSKEEKTSQRLYHNKREFVEGVQEGGRTKVALTIEKTMKKAVSLSAAMKELGQQYPRIFKRDEDEIKHTTLHPPRPNIYDLDSLIAFQGISWDTDGFAAMELSALPWLAFVGHEQRAQEQCIVAGSAEPRRRKWRPCKFEPPSVASYDVDLFVFLHSGMPLPDWFVSGKTVEPSELEGGSTVEEGYWYNIDALEEPSPLK
ncbi:hypothetical protein BDY19DRAFT_908556 [Irpex rosettiformis]|uniref:Uncharacterized protein n=1 Tax=Irpex rosettiformis TaxID=378272 RepID=A0ACB8TW00_9APHY|nr:hypothetical protein BDY19DRAFT_908556 [Irpex rosettiformis]